MRNSWKATIKEVGLRTIIGAVAGAAIGVGTKAVEPNSHVNCETLALTGTALGALVGFASKAYNALRYG